MPLSTDFRWLRKRDHELHERSDKLMWSMWGYPFPNSSSRRIWMGRLNKLLGVRNALSQDILKFQNRIRTEGKMGLHPTGVNRERVRGFRRQHTELSRLIRALERDFEKMR